MMTVQAVSDKFSIGLSAVCAIHCLVLPVVLAFVPSIAALHLDNELFHHWMVGIVVPISLYALTLGCMQHKRYQLLALGSVGLVLLVMALLLGEDRIGGAGEKILTILGAGCVALGHWFNYRHCRLQSHSECGCVD